MKVLIVSDLANKTLSLERIFTQAGFSVEWCIDLRKWVGQSLSSKYTAILFKHPLPYWKLYEHYLVWRQTGCTSKFIVLAYSSGFERAELLQAGADAYFIEPCSYQAVIQEIKENQKTDSVAELTLGNLRIDLSNYLVWREDTLILLSRIQQAILKYFILHQNIVLTRLQIWEEVWGYQ